MQDPDQEALDELHNKLENKKTQITELKNKLKTKEDESNQLAGELFPSS